MRFSCSGPSTLSNYKTFIFISVILIHQGVKYKDEILRDVNVDPEKNIKKAKYVKKDTMAKFEADLLRMLEEKDKIVNLTYAIVKLCGQEIQKRPEYADCVEIQNLKFSNTMIWWCRERWWRQRFGRVGGSSRRTPWEAESSKENKQLFLSYVEKLPKE